MDIADAERGAPIAAEIRRIEGLISSLDTILSEGWQVTLVQVTAPAEGASQPAGTVVSLVPVGASGKALSESGLQMAKDGYAQELTALYAQLEGM